jgi:hypothetical protein
MFRRGTAIRLTVRSIALSKAFAKVVDHHVNAPLTIKKHAPAHETAGIGSKGRQPFGKADGVTPAGFLTGEEMRGIHSKTGDHHARC